MRYRIYPRTRDTKYHVDLWLCINRTHELLARDWSIFQQGAFITSVLTLRVLYKYNTKLMWLIKAAKRVILPKYIPKRGMLTRTKLEWGFSSPSTKPAVAVGAFKCNRKYLNCSMGGPGGLRFGRRGWTNMCANFTTKKPKLYISPTEAHAALLFSSV